MLDGITEELEEQQQSGDGSAAAAAASFSSLQFLTEQQMQQLNAQQLIGTPLVTRYLHGYFIARELYDQLKASCKLQRIRVASDALIQPAAAVAAAASVASQAAGQP